MTVIQVKGRTTESEEYFDNHSLSNSSYIYTTASEKNIEEYSLELTVGSGWNNSYSPKNRGLIAITEGITIQRHGSIVVEVGEEIHVPHNRYGIVLPTGSMFLSQGILVASAKVEPAFIGKLKLRMYNTTDREANISKGEKIGSVIFFSTESTKVHDKIYKNSETSSTVPTLYQNLRRWLSANKPLWIGWLVTSIISPLLVLFLTYFFYFKPDLENQVRAALTAGQLASKEESQNMDIKSPPHNHSSLTNEQENHSSDSATTVTPLAGEQSE